jgi:membrane protein DedA with SNARE-associated domain/rhodanese-related sulfurtransferase
VTSSFELTYPGVLLAVFGEQLCLPIPSIVFLMAAGALSARGEMRTSIIVLMGVLGCVVADGLWFWFGRRWGSQTLGLVCRFTSDPRAYALNAREQFRRYGLALLCVAKFFPGMNLVMPPLAAAEGASFASFFPLDLLGGLLWSGFYVGLGYIFSRQVDVAIRMVEHFGKALAIGIGVPLCLFVGWRGLALIRTIRRLRLRRISPQLLASKLKSKSKVAVLDLLNFEDESNSRSTEAIPGAMRVDPLRLRKSPHITVPQGVDIVLYSSSGSDTVAARAAQGLKRVGIDNVWVLEGGLKAWRQQGLPVAQSPVADQVAAERVGVHLPRP